MHVLARYAKTQGILFKLATCTGAHEDGIIQFAFCLFPLPDS